MEKVSGQMADMGGAARMMTFVEVVPDWTGVITGAVVA